MTVDEIKSFLQATGWKLNSAGNFNKVLEVKGPLGLEARHIYIYINKKSITIRMKMRASSGYVRLGGAPFVRCIRRTSDGAMVVGSYAFQPPARK